MTEYTFVIPGRPITKKNSQQIFRRGKGRPFITQSKAYKKFEQSAVRELLPQKTEETITKKVDLCVKYYMPNYASWPDLIGLLQATSDILEKAGIIENDKNIKHYGFRGNHSEIVGVDKDNPRTEIRLKILEVEDDD